MDITCPTCGSPSIELPLMNVSIMGKRSKLMKVYRCKNKKCLIEIPCPENTLWPTEFVILEINGEKHIVRPSADEFP